jgi:beta-ribofuranosylaminobenzene 5'-phosphate synthase
MRVLVETGARLHLGFYRPFVRGGRVLGGLGLGIDADGLSVRLVAVPSSSIRVESPEACRSTALEAARRASRSFSLRGMIVRVEECLPRHRGLGSTTQLVLAVYAAAAALAGGSVEEAVERAGRGFYSGVGSGVFLRGGLVVDAGAPLGSARPRPAAWAYPPRDWGIVVAVPEAGPRVMEGPREGRLIEEAVARVDPRACLRGYAALLDMVLPGAAEANFELFTRGLEEIEAATAAAFAGQQGGGMCCRESEEAALLLRRLGARGVGQSSWGPAVYGFFPSVSLASSAAERLSLLLRRGGVSASVFVARPRLRGAVVRLLS